MLAAHADTCILYAFDLIIFKGLTMACGSKTGGHIRRTDNWDSEDTSNTYIGYLDLLMFNVIFSFQ